MQRLTSCGSFEDKKKRKKDWTFQLSSHRLPRAMSLHHAKTIDVTFFPVVYAYPQIPQECTFITL